MEANRKLVSQLIAEAKEDEVGLWLVIATLRNELGITDPVALRARTLDCVRELLDSGEVVAGYYKSDGSGVALWNMSIPEVTSRIQQEWADLGREPSIGEIVVFVGR
jgi:hypothetical protein